MKQMLNEEYNTALTENGAIAYKTSGKALLDLNFRVSCINKFYYNIPSGIFWYQRH